VGLGDGQHGATCWVPQQGRAPHWLCRPPSSLKLSSSSGSGSSCSPDECSKAVAAAVGSFVLMVRLLVVVVGGGAGGRTACVSQIKGVSTTNRTEKGPHARS